MPDVAALESAVAELAVAGIPHVEWTEPDFDMGFTSIATVPLSREQKAPLAHYPLWCPRFYTSACNSEKEWSSAHKAEERSVVRVHPGAPNLFPRSSGVERSVTTERSVARSHPGEPVMGNGVSVQLGVEIASEASSGSDMLKFSTSSKCAPVA